MNRFSLHIAMVAVFALGSLDVVLAGGSGTRKERDSRLTNAQVEECAKDPEKLKTLVRNRASTVKGDALARVLDQIAKDEGLDSPKIDQVLTLGFDDSLRISARIMAQRMGTAMRKFDIKDDILVKIRDSQGDDIAQTFQRYSGARYPVAGGSDGGGDDQGAAQDQQGDTGAGDTGQTGQNTPPPPVQDDPEPPAEEPVPPPQPPVGQPYAGQQLL